MTYGESEVKGKGCNYAFDKPTSWTEAVLTATMPPARVQASSAGFSQKS